MNQPQPGTDQGDPHRLVPLNLTRQRKHTRLLYMSGLAVVLGVVVGVAWLAYHRLIPVPFMTGSQEMASQSDTTQEAAPDQSDGPTPASSPTQNSPTQIANGQTAAANQPGAEFPASGIAAATALPSSAMQVAQANAPPRTSTPTATSTPVPYLDSAEGVVGLGGANLWEAGDGRLIQPLVQGVLVTVLARSEDGAWLQVETEDGIQGWTASEDLIVFDVDRLRPQPVVLMPITPTPTVIGADPESDDADGQAQTAMSADEDAAGSVLRPTPVVEEGEPTVQVIVTEGRLNIRAGPGASYEIIAKAFPDEVFLVTGRNDAGDWLKITVTNVDGGFGWVSAGYVESSEPVSGLPVVTGVSDAPTYTEPADSVAPGSTGRGAGDALQTQPAYAARRDRDAAYRAAHNVAPNVAPIKVAHAAPKKPPTASVTGLHGKLAIQQEWGGDIYLYDLVTGELRLLTGGFDPSLSPDGSRVAFTRDGGEHGLYIINVDGTGEHLIFSGRETLRSPKWSPDGQYIVFEHGEQEVFCRGVRARCMRAILGEDGELPETETQPRLARVDVNGGSYQDIPVLLYARAPDWNEGGITYMSGAGIQATLDEPGATTRVVFFQQFKEYEMDPDWQPNNGRIVFQRRELSHWEIFSVNPDGSDFTALTRPEFTLVDEIPSNVAPAWSYDGRHIVFLSNRLPDKSAGAWNVWVMDGDGSNQRRLPIDLPFTYTFVAEQMLDWGP